MGMLPGMLPAQVEPQAVRRRKAAEDVPREAEQPPIGKPRVEVPSVPVLWSLAKDTGNGETPKGKDTKQPTGEQRARCGAWSVGSLCLEETEGRRKFLLNLAEAEEDRKSDAKEWVRSRATAEAYRQLMSGGGMASAVAGQTAAAVDVVGQELYAYMSIGVDEDSNSAPKRGLLGWLHERSRRQHHRARAAGEEGAGSDDKEGYLAAEENGGGGLSGRPSLADLERFYERQYHAQVAEETHERRESFLAFMSKVQMARRVFEAGRACGASLRDTLAALTAEEALAVTVVLELHFKRVGRVPRWSPQANLQRMLGIVSGAEGEEKGAERGEGQEEERRERKNVASGRRRGWRRKSLSPTLKMALIWRDLAVSFQVIMYLMVAVSNIVSTIFFVISFASPDYWMTSGGSIGLALLVMAFTTAFVLLAPLCADAFYWMLFRDTITDRTSVTAKQASISALLAHTTAGTLVCLLLLMDWIAGLDETEGRLDSFHYQVCMLSFLLLAYSATTVVFNLPGTFRWCARWAAYYAALPAIQKAVAPVDGIAGGPPEARFGTGYAAAAASSSDMLHRPSGLETGLNTDVTVGPDTQFVVTPAPRPYDVGAPLFTNQAQVNAVHWE